MLAPALDRGWGLRKSVEFGGEKTELALGEENEEKKEKERVVRMFQKSVAPIRAERLPLGGKEGGRGREKGERGGRGRQSPSRCQVKTSSHLISPILISTSAADVCLKA